MTKPVEDDIRANEKPKKNQGGRPRKDLTKTPEFEAAVAAAAEAAERRILSQLAGLREGKVPEGVDAGDRQLLERLALSIAEISDQGTNRKRVAPEVLAARNAAYDRMLQIIVRNHTRGWPAGQPAYKVTSQTFLNEQLIQPFLTDPITKAIEPQVIDWTGIPNEALEPLNEIAEQIMIEYRQWLGGAQALTPNADTRPMIVTPSGLTIRGTGMARRQVGTVQPQERGPSNERDLNAGDPNAGFEHRLGVRGPNDPRAKQVRVLGTVAKPAEQNSI